MLESIQILYGHEERIWHCAWSPNGLHFTSCGEDKVIRIWSCINLDTAMDPKTEISFQCVSTLEEGQTRTIRSCEWSPNCRMIASASFDGTVSVWQSQDHTLRNWDQVASLDGHDNEVKSVSWSSDGRWLASCGRDKKVWIWEKLGSNDFECVCMLEGHTQDVKFVKWHPSLNVLLSSSYDDTIKVWKEDDSDWFCVDTIQGHRSTVWGLSINFHGNKIISCSDDKSIILWESDNIEERGSFRKAAFIQDLHKYAIYSVDWSHSHGLIATGAGDNMISICSSSKSDGIDTLSVDCKVKNGHDGDVNCVRWNPSRHNHLSYLLLSAGDDCVLKLWRYIPT
eukprot:gene13854-18580_t